MQTKLKNKNIFIIMLISIAAVIVRGFMIKYESGDYLLFLSQWCEHLEMNGGFKGILTVDADYNMIYLYFLALFTYLPFNYLYSIKVLSIVFDFALAVSAYLLVNQVMEKSEKRKNCSIIAYGVVLFLPTVVLNSSFWAQCDSIYTTFVLLSLLFLFKKRYNTCFILYGAALTIKLQAIFFLPVYGIIYLKNKDFPIYKFGWILIVNFILFIPAMIIGKPISSIFDAYTTQIGKYSYKTVFGYPNIYNLFPINAVQLNKPGIVFTMCLLIVLMIIVLRTKGKLSNNEIMELGIVVVLLVTYFLPEMHDRYAYVAEVLSIIYFIIVRKNLPAVLLINICAFATYMMCLTGLMEEFMPLLSIIQFIPLFIFTKKFIEARMSSNKYIKKETVN